MVFNPLFQAVPPAAVTLAQILETETGSSGLTTTQQNAVSTVPTLLVPARYGAPGTGRKAAVIVNQGGVDIWVGNINVTTTTGVKISPGSARTINTMTALYGVVLSDPGACDVEENF